MKASITSGLIEQQAIGLYRKQESYQTLPNGKDTPLDYMGALKLSYVYQRIQAMIDLLQDLPKGTTDDAIIVYRQIGESIRQKVKYETGHYPEEFSVPDGIITGDEEPSQFKLRDHQPPLF